MSISGRKKLRVKTFLSTLYAMKDRVRAQIEKLTISMSGYSKVSNISTGIFISFWLIFPPERSNQDQYGYFS